MIRKITPIAFDSFGVRSMATFVETDDLRILIDPAASLAPIRYGFGPHLLERQRLDEAWEAIRQYAETADELEVKVATAAEFCGRKNEMLEALRKKLYTKYGEAEVKGKNVY